MKIYVASSWRNQYQPSVVAALRKEGHEVYDFRQPQPGDNGFHWSEIDKNWQQWDTQRYANSLNHPIAESGFNKDFSAMKWADACVLVLPCGRSAHLEAGWFAGAGKPAYILMPESCEPELMYKMNNGIFPSVECLLKYLESK